MSVPFAISFVDEADVRIIDITGEIDLETAPAFAAQLDDAAESGVHNVVVNLCDVSFMDSTAMGTLIRGRKQLEDGGARVRLAYVLDGAPSRAMALAKVDRLFTVYNTRADALAALQRYPVNTSSTGMGRSPGTSDLRLEVLALPDHVVEIRRAVVEYAEGLGADDMWPIALAVSEAVTNAVVHAYRDSDAGSVRVTARALSGEELTVVVEDNGAGLLPRADSPGSGLGLPLLALLTNSVTIETRPEGGTRVSMTFAI